MQFVLFTRITGITRLVFLFQFLLFRVSCSHGQAGATVVHWSISSQALHGGKLGGSCRLNSTLNTDRQNSFGIIMINPQYLQLLLLPRLLGGANILIYFIIHRSRFFSILAKQELSNLLSTAAEDGSSQALSKIFCEFVHLYWY